MQALGLEFIGPQTPHGPCSESAPNDVPADTRSSRRLTTLAIVQQLQKPVKLRARFARLP